jgi:acid phosphatase class B
MTAIFDIDNTLVDSIRPFLRWYNLKHKKNFSYSDITNHNLELILGRKNEDIKNDFKEFFLSDHAFEIKPIYGAKGVLSLVKNYGDTVILLTDRESAVKEKTQDMIETYFPNLVKDIIFTTKDNKQKQKIDYIKTIQPIIYFDDDPSHIRVAHEKGYFSIMPIRPWNGECAIPPNQKIRDLGTGRSIICYAYKK